MGWILMKYRERCHESLNQECTKKRFMGNFGVDAQDPGRFVLPEIKPNERCNAVVLFARK